MKIRRRIIWIISIFIVLIFIMFIFLNTSTSSSNDKTTIKDFDETKKVLLISSYSPSFETFFDQIEGIKSQFEDRNIVLDIEFMDSKRLFTYENMTNFYISLKYKLDNLSPYDLILSADDNALNFILEHKKELFDNVPVVFFGVNDHDNAMVASDNPYITGIIEEASIYETIEIAYKLSPQAKNVVAITDNTTSGQADLVSYYELENSFDNLEFKDLDLSNYSFEEYAQKLQMLNKEDIVLLLSLYSNKDGEKLLFDEGLQFLIKNCSQPIYHPYYHGLGDGVLGGKVISHYEQGLCAGSIAIDILSGESIEKVCLNDDSNKYIFDYDLLQKYNINKKLLPEETEYINKETSLLDDYREYVIYAIGLLILLILIISMLSYNIIQKNKAENNLKKKNLLLESQKKKINNIINLTARIGSEDDKINSKEAFLSDLLNTSFEVIEEADYGIVFMYEDDTAVFVDVIGHNESLKGLKIKSFLDIQELTNVIKIKDGKQMLLSKATKNEKGVLNAHMKPSSESMVIILSYNDEKIAGMALEKADDAFSKESINLLKTLLNIPVAFFSQMAFYQEKNSMFEGIVFSIIKILSLHNEYTKKHSMNVANIASRIAEELGLNKNEIDLVNWTGLVHDIGKILIPEDILDKKSKLADEEWEIIKKHSVWGYETLIENKNLKEVAKNVLYHHERWDGKGYPKGISGEEIPLVSRIIAVADTYDAITNKRPYREVLSKEAAVKEIVNNSGTQFDPAIVKTFLDNIDIILERVNDMQK